MASVKRAILSVLACVSAVSLAGCAAGVAMGAMGARLVTPDTVTHKAEFTIGPRAIVVIPFRDQAHTYYESGDGLDLATAIQGELLLRKAASNVKSDEGVRRDFAGQDLDRVGWSAVGKAAGAQLVLTGGIQIFRLKDPGVIGMLRGTAKVDVSIYDVEKNAVVFAIRGLEVYVPDRGAGIAQNDMDPERLRTLLVSTTAMKIVQSFYTWEKKIGPEPTRF